MKNLQKRATGIYDGIRTNTGARYYKFGGAEGDVWFGGQSWINSETQVRQQIHSATGTMISQAATIANLRKEVDEWSSFRAGFVAEHPGWLGNIFVCGDGTYKAGENQPALDVVAFQPQPKFLQQGTVEDWLRNMKPFVSGQVLPFFVCCLALSGPVLRLLPSGLVPPQVELVGAAKSGKSTLGVLAASVWSGMPGKTEGGGENWDMTINAYDVHRRNHRDMLLMLDEGENSAPSSSGRREVAKTIVMKGASTASKVRYNDIQAAPQLRVPILSTTNTPLRDVLRGAGADALAAVTSRMLSLYMIREDSGTSIFGSIPEGFATIEEAVHALRSLVDETYGTVGPAFAAGLADLLADDEEALRRRIKHGIEAARQRLRRQRPDGDQRHRDMLATIEVAGCLAQELGVLPKGWGDPTSVIDFIYNQGDINAEGQEQIAENETRRFMDYLRREIGARKAFPLWAPKRLCSSFPIVVKRTKQGGIAYMQPDHFQATFPHFRSFLNEMKRQGKLIQHHSEQNDRLQVHAPTDIKKYGFKRVYAVLIGDDTITEIKTARHELHAKTAKSKKTSSKVKKVSKERPRLGVINGRRLPNP